MKKYRIAGILIFVGLAIWMGLEMKNRTAEELLWGYRPLGLFLGIWLALMFLILPRFSKHPKSYQLFGISTLSGILMGLGFPDVFSLPFILFGSFIPLLIVEKEIAEHWDRPAFWEVFKYSYHTFILFNIISTYWVGNSALVAGLFAISVNAALMCIPILLFHWTKKRLPKLGYLSFVTYWICFEYVHFNWELTWPWLALGHGFAAFPSLVQWYEYTGVLGGTLWVLLLNLFLFFEMNKWMQESVKPNTTKMLQLFALVSIPILFSLFIYYNYKEQGRLEEVVVVQPNYEPHYIKFTVPARAQLDNFLKLTTDAVNENTDYVVYPESSFGYVNTDQLEREKIINDLKQFLTPYPNLKMVSGFNAYNVFDNGEPHSAAVRTRVNRRGDTTYLEVLNIAAQLSNEVEEIPVYRKSKLVPGPEILPYRNLLFFLEPIANMLDGTSAGVGTQAQRAVFESSSGKIGPAICYESVFGAYYGGYVRKGAEAIFIMTNDGWWDNTAGHRQHLYYASLRAIETRRPIARSANTGVSAFINQRGDILQPIPYDEPGAIKSELRFNKKLTFYTKFGDLIARISVFLAAILLLNAFVKGQLRTSAS